MCWLVVFAEISCSSTAALLASLFLFFLGGGRGAV